MSDFILTPTLSKAARALLGWNQLKLANRARVGVSTVADFERGKRSPVAHNIDAMVNALRAGGATFAHGGGVTLQSTRPSGAIALPGGNPLRWVSGTALEEWGRRRDAQALFPELMHRLIYATAADGCNYLKFRAAEGISQSGWDGLCEARGKILHPTYLPLGRSGWELTVQKENLKAKSTDDYLKRTAAVAAAERANTTFVIATTSRWAGGEEWAQLRRAEGNWKDVRVLDADDLVHWVEQFPQIGLWLAVKTGNRPVELLELDEVWREWRNSTSIPISTELMLADRDDQAIEVLNWLYNDASIFAVQAESVEEAMAFLYASIDQLPDPYKTELHSRCIVVQSEKAARALGKGPAPLNIVLDEANPGLAHSLVELGHHVYLPLGSAIGAPDSVHELPRPSYDAFLAALINIQRDGEHDDDRCKQLTSDSVRSFSVLRRLIPFAPNTEGPKWSRPEIGRALLPLVLAGAWDTNYSGDKEILERLAQRPFEELEDAYTRWANIADSPLRQAGDTWKIASPRDAWLRLAPLVNGSDIKRLEAVIHDVFVKPDPRYEIPRERRWMSGWTEKPSQSNYILDGLAQTLLLLSIFGDQAKGAPLAKSLADRVVRKLLRGADERRWWSLNSRLTLLAEASPLEFLAAAGESLDASPSPIMVLFGEDGGMFGGRSYHVNLLFALEMLAWSPAYIAGSSLLLARLAKLDPGGQVSNRPKNSLRDIFLLWMPQTNATLEERFKVIDVLRRDVPDITWQMMIGLLPTGHDAVSPTPKPRWRDFSVKESEEVTYAVIATGVDRLLQRLLQDAGTDAGRWTDLLDKYQTLPPRRREEFVKALARASIHFVDDKDRLKIWPALRRTLHHHRAFSDAEWSLEESELQPLEEIYDALEPADTVQRIAWLFAAWNVTQLPNPSDGNHGEEADERSREIRERILAEYLQTEGEDAVFRLVESVEFPFSVGRTISSLTIDSQRLEAILFAALKSESKSCVGFAAGIVQTRIQQIGDEWMAETIEHARAAQLSSEAISNLLHIATPSLAHWKRVRSFGVKLTRAYWERVTVLIGHDKDKRFIDEAVRNLVKVGRARSAVRLLASAQIPVDSSILIKALDSAVNSAETDPSESNAATMFQWSVEQLLGKLDKDEGVGKETIARLEWAYLALLQYSNRPPGVLRRMMSTFPQLYLEVLSAVFRASQESGIEEPDPTERTKAIASNAFTLLESWNVIPGETDGVIDATVLVDWVTRARTLCENAGRGELGDQYIGRMLSYSPIGDDQIWPCQAVRRLIESVKSTQIENGIVMGVHSKRGVTMRAPLDGGKQERAIAQQYARWASQLALEWPTTASLIDRISRSFDEDAVRHDHDAERNDWEQG